MQDICERPPLNVLWPPLNVLNFIISQKRKHFKSNNNCKSKGNVYILKLKFYLKSRSAACFFRIIFNKALLIFAFTVFLVDSLHSSKKKKKKKKIIFNIYKNVPQKKKKKKKKKLYLIFLKRCCKT